MTTRTQNDEARSPIPVHTLILLMACILPFGCAPDEAARPAAATLDAREESCRNIERLIGAQLPPSATSCRYYSQDVGGWGGGMEFAYFALPEGDALALLDESPRLPDACELRSDPMEWNVERVTDKNGKIIPWWQPQDLQEKRFASRRHPELVWSMYVCIGRTDSRTGVYIFYQCD